MGILKSAGTPKDLELALSLPAGPARDTVLGLTYCTVIFSILVQGQSMGRVARRMAA
jgi:CPA1 family monovalent cation:H+ antiporter